MLIDDLLPVYDVREQHRVQVRASPSAVYAAISTTDLGDDRLVRALLFARALPGAMRHGIEGVRALGRGGRAPATLQTLEANGFRILAERPPAEMAIGIEGRFWVLGRAVCTPPAESFRGEIPAGMARVVWDFRVVSRGLDVVELTTETRVKCADAATRRRFIPYWMIIRPGSGLIRRAILRAIKKTAEASGSV